jgi:Ser/Thr protein kinase RdoA (MazF antagonist)
MSADDLIDYVRATFGLDRTTPATLTPSGRGALGQISRLDIGSRRYPVKELFDNEAPASALIAAEVEFTALAAAIGIPVAASHPATDGRYIVPTRSGPGWLRLNDWLNTTPLPLRADALPTQLGTLLGRLHTCAPPPIGNPAAQHRTRGTTCHPPPTGGRQ